MNPKNSQKFRVLLSFGKNSMLNEYEIGWMMLKKYTGKGYASEAAQAYAEYFCAAYDVDYLIVVMDVDNPALYKAAENAVSSYLKKRTISITLWTISCMRSMSEMKK